VHGDLTGSNLLVRDRRLSAVIDFGCTAIGDPASDLTVAWTTFDGPSREPFRRKVEVDGDAVGQGPGLGALGGREGPLDAARRPPRDDGTRLGRRRSSARVVDALIADLSV
jgi:hypothetical protein